MSAIKTKCDICGTEFRHGDVIAMSAAMTQ